MEHVDALSRSPVVPPSEIEKDIMELILQVEDEAITIQNADPSLKYIRETLEIDPEERTIEQKNEIKDFKLENGKVVKEIEVDGEKKSHFVIPKSMRKGIA